jgi:DNA (cytosine-5)-methyltransferase 1
VSLSVGSLFSGIGGFDLAAERAGMQIVFQCEIDPFCRKVLALRFPGVPCYEDVRLMTAHNTPRVDVLVAGVPCQDVSVAGKRAGLHGERTGLFFEFTRLLQELRPQWGVFENVPGLLSSHGGRDFHAVLHTLAECGFRRAYRILDSQHWGVAQRRRRVFIVCRARTERDGAEAVLFESASGSGDSQAGAAAGARVAACLRGRSHGAGVNMPGRGGEDDQNLVAYAIGSHAGAADGDQTNRSHASGGPVGMNISEELGFSLCAGRTQAIAFGWNKSASQTGRLAGSGGNSETAGPGSD